MLTSDLFATDRMRDIIGGKRAEEALRDDEQRYRTLFNLAPVAVYSCDVSGVIQDYNNRAAELWGRKPEPEDTDERFCGSFKINRPDGSFLPHEQCPMGDVLSGKAPSTRPRRAERVVLANGFATIARVFHVRRLGCAAGLPGRVAR